MMPDWTVSKTLMPTASDEEIANYYDVNTGKFLRFGGSGDVAAIHRAIWAPGVTQRQEAFLFLNELVVKAAQPLTQKYNETLRILDLGCGVGGTSTWLHHRLKADVLGVNISERQVQQARLRVQELGCANHVSFAASSFEESVSDGPYHAACAIESFVHCQHPELFLKAVRENLLPGGRLIICDDFANALTQPGAEKWVVRFKRGWKINNFLTREELLSLASEHGFRLLTATDLSPYVRPFPSPALFMLRWLTRIPLPGAYWQNLAGGTALQICLKRSYTKYHAIVLERI